MNSVHVLCCKMYFNLLRPRLNLLLVIMIDHGLYLLHALHKARLFDKNTLMGGVVTLSRSVTRPVMSLSLETTKIDTLKLA